MSESIHNSKKLIKSARKRTLRTMTANVNSFKNFSKLNMILMYMKDKMIDVAFLTEIKLDPDYNLILLDDYRIERVDRNQHGGGVAIVCHKSLSCSVVETSENKKANDTEYII